MAKPTQTTGEYIHIHLGTELGKAFHAYYHRTKLGKTAIVTTLLRRYLEARSKGQNTISAVL